MYENIYLLKQFRRLSYGTKIFFSGTIKQVSLATWRDDMRVAVTKQTERGLSYHVHMPLLCKNGKKHRSMRAGYIAHVNIKVVVAARCCKPFLGSAKLFLPSFYSFTFLAAKCRP